MVEEGKQNELIPLDLWPEMHSAQRFLSLSTPDSEEEIFSYCQADKNPKTLRSVKTPMLVIFAGNDEYKDRPIQKIVKWFDENIKSKEYSIHVVKGAPHNMTDKEDEVVGLIRNWIG